ncbi:MAG TPA: MlaD family protein [Allosphingosinicella sp.]|jgi:phospholipid/cholesterol/gamma-HCH transport system substrate-binding protein|nr:MlaD family protein [Allosphingosinicella sp.]
METRSNHILVGSVVMALLAAVVVFIVWISQAGGKQDKLYDIFFSQAVDGLAPGSAVTFSGVPVGQVKAISLQPQTPELVRVRIAVGRDTPVIVGTTASVNGVGFTGVSQIQLAPPERTRQQQTGRAEIACPDDPSPKCPYGVPVIPTKAGGLAAVLNSAPELLNKVTTLTERLTDLLSDKNQNSIAAILQNVKVISKNLADRSDEIAATMADARVAIRQAGDAADHFAKLADTSNDILAHDARPMIADLRKTIQSAQTSMNNLDAAISEAKPGIHTFSTRTLPEAGQLIHDLQQTSESLRSVSERFDREGVRGIIGGQKLPDYRAGKQKR